MDSKVENSTEIKSKEFFDLTQLKVGETATILTVEGSEQFRLRIQEMGLVPEETLKIEKIAPLGGPIVVRIQGYKLGLRKEEAVQIKVTLEKKSPKIHKKVDALKCEKSNALTQVAIIGNPNCGKTTVFNGLTGLHQRVGNYPGITVEKRLGSCSLSDNSSLNLIDLPGTYSLTAVSPEEKITVKLLKNEVDGVSKIDGVLVIIDADNLARNLLIFTQVVEYGFPMVVGLTMCDMAKRRGRPVDAEKLEKYLGVPVVPMVASKNQGFSELKQAFSKARKPIAGQWHSSEKPSQKTTTNDVQNRYKWIASVVGDVVGYQEPLRTVSDRIDHFLVHRVAGLAFFVMIMFSVFCMIYTIADPFMGMTEDAIAFIGNFLFSSMPEGALKSLLLNGVVAGVGGVLVFVPQIAILFLCISLLEESGYLARAAFLLDRLLSVVGLHGKSFIPMLSSHACAIPGIMAARTIESRKDRMITMFVAPFMSCGARLPVYTLLISVFLAPYGALMQGVALISCYMLGIVAAITTALLLRKTAFKEPSSAFLLELPAYQLPQIGQVLRIVFRNSMLFVRKATTVIMGFSILLWAALYYPKMDDSQIEKVLKQQGFSVESYEKSLSDGSDSAKVKRTKGLLGGTQVEQSIAGRVGKFIEPVIAPMGYDWKIGIGLIGAFAAREVFVSTMGIVYSVGDDTDEESVGLHDAMINDTRKDGSKVWTMPVVFSVFFFFIIAMQCISTVVVMKQETGSWKVPLIQLAFMNTVAYIGATLIFQIGTLIS